MLLSEDRLEDVKKTVPCRDGQLDLLNSILSQTPEECPSAILVHGASATGKTWTLRAFLDAAPLNYSVVNCDQCSTTRIMLQRALADIRRDSGIEAVQAASDETGKETAEEAGEVAGPRIETVAENFSAFYLAVKEYFDSHNYTDKPHVLLLDRIDCLPDDPSDLYSSFARLPELTPLRNLVVIFTISTLEPRALITTPIPHVQFSRYSREDSIRVMQSRPLHKLPQEYLGKVASEHDAAPESIERAQQTFWNRYIALVIDALSSYTGTDIRLIKEAAKRIWPQFIRPLKEGQVQDASANFVTLYKKSQHLFSSEAAVLKNLVDSMDQSTGASSELPVQSKYLLCAAYLASYNPPRYDIRFFSRAKEARAKRRDTQRRKKLKINPRSLAAPAFDLERMLAILHAIAPEDGFVSNIDVGVQIATLTTLKLIVRTSQFDPLDSRTRWKVNASWQFVKALAAEIGLQLEDYLIE